MRLIDITRELTAAPCWPGDPTPQLEPVLRVSQGDVCNLTVLHACLHNGTHVDAPLHFFDEVDDIAAIPLDVCIGECTVVCAEGDVTGEMAERWVPCLGDRLLIKGNASLTQSAAFVLSDAGVRLVGVEGTSVASADCTAAVHRHLLSCGVVLLEGLDLSKAEPGVYMLFAAPLKIAGADGAPVRAVLFERQI